MNYTAKQEAAIENLKALDALAQRANGLWHSLETLKAQIAKNGRR